MRVENAVRNGLLVGLTALSLSFSPSWVGAADEPVAADSKAPTAEVQKEGKTRRKALAERGRRTHSPRASGYEVSGRVCSKADLSRRRHKGRGLDGGQRRRDDREPG